MVFTLSFDASSPAGLANLDAFIRGRSYVVGFSATQTDVELFTALGKAPDAGKYPNLARYYNHIASFSADARGKFPAAFTGGAAAPAKTAGGAGAGAGAGGKGGKAAAAAAPAPAPAAADDDDAAGLFGDDDEAAAAKVTAAAKAAAKPAEAGAGGGGKKAKAPLIEKSSVVYEVKPMKAGQDMKALQEAIRAITIDGLTWGEQMKVVDVAFGIQKLVIQAVIEDEKVALEDIEEKILAIPGPEDDPDMEGKQVSSIDLCSMNKVT